MMRTSTSPERAMARWRHDRRWRPSGRRGIERTVVEIVVAAVIGAALGTILSMDWVVDVVPGLGAVAFVADVASARSAVGGLFGIQITLVTIILSITTLTYQSIASQYSPRLVALLASSEPLYRSIGLFALTGAYTIAAIRQLGLSAVAGPAPRPVIVVAIILLLLALGFVVANMVRVFQRIQVEEIVNAVGGLVLSAANRLAAARGALAPSSAAPPQPPTDVTPISAPRSGYIVAVDLPRLSAYARDLNAPIRIDRRIGEYVVAGETIGWYAGPAGAMPPGIARAVFVERQRRPVLDVGLGLRVLADVADRALSPAVNDPTTARESLHQMRRALRDIAAMPLGDITVAGEDGHPLASLASPDLADYLATAVDGVSRYGAGDPDVVSEILVLALEVGRAAATSEARAAAAAVAERAIADAAHIGHLDDARLAVLRRQAAVVAQALAEGASPLPATLRRGDVAGSTAAPSWRPSPA